MCSLAVGIPGGSSVSFLAASGRTSDLVGQGRRNLTRLFERFALKVAKVREDASLKNSAITLQWSGGERSGDLGDCAD
jgi:hypothetical protein